MAKELYARGIKEVAQFRSFGDEYAAYAYFGLSRISKADGDINNEKLYRKLALKIAVFSNINFDD